MQEIAVLIPCYNEALTIRKVIQSFRKELPSASIYVYDNNSTDDTFEIARKEGVIVRKEYHQGKGNVIRRMFREIKADCYLIVDGDNTYPAESAKDMCREVLEHGVDMVIGDRLSTSYFKENKRLFHNTGNKTMCRLINYLFNANICDIMTGYRAMSPLFVKNFPVLSHGFEIETEMTIHALDKRFLIREIPVDYRDRPAGSVSKLNTFTDGFRVLYTVFSLFKDYKPMKFFSACALILISLGTLLFIPVLIEYFQTGLVPRFPTLIVSGFILLIAILLWICGLILEVIGKKHRQLYELMLNKSQVF
ncbi:MAG: glycosyltransferase family 2 protein [Bacteroidales bacterium]